MSQNTDFQENFSFLNDAQKEVVEEIYGPIMVVAGPGTGKTQIIALRTANIILKGKVNPENILITTFTEAGVIAIKKRLAKFIGTEAYKVKVSTIHSFAQDVITSFPEKFAEYKAASTIDDIGALQALTEILDAQIQNGSIEYLFHPFDRYMYLRDIKDRIGKLKGEGISPEKFIDIIANQRNEYDQKLEDLKTNKRIRDLEKRTAKDSETFKKHIGKLRELQLIYELYSKYLRENSLYDFSDMINFVVEKMRVDMDMLSHYAEKHQFIMIDEYQDTNNPQNEIMNMILSVGDEKNIMVVGDDDQSIYRFQGANIENMLDFYNNYPETKFIVLENNYRSAQSILNLSQNLIENNSERLVNRLDFLQKNLIAQSDYKDLDENEYLILSDALAEKVFVQEDIAKKQAEEKSFAVIVRSNREVQEWTDFFSSQGIAVESKLKTNILKNKYVLLILDIFKIIENPHRDDAMLMNLLRSELIDVENIDVITLGRDMYKKNYSRSGFMLQLWDVIEKVDIDYADKYHEDDEEYSFETRQEEKFRDYKKILAFRDLVLELHAESAIVSGSGLVSTIVERLGITQHIEAHGSFSDLEDIFTLFQHIESYQERNARFTIADIIIKLDLHIQFNLGIQRQVLKKSSSNIEILTAHGSKGLEYDHVYIPGLYGGNWENKRMINKLKLPLGVVGEGLQFAGMDDKERVKIEKEMALQEDRRLFFVAITRAKQSLYFLRPAGKDNKPYIDSPFLVEMGVSGKMHDIDVPEEILTKNIHNILGSTLVHTSHEEIEYIGDFLETYKLSPTDLNAFLEDPKQFLQNVVFKYPFTGNEFTIFGNVYHKVLEESIRKQFNGEIVELGFMTERFTQLLDTQLLTAEEKPRLLKKGIDGLTGYYEQFSKNPRTPLKVEYNFRSRNVVFAGIPITGKIDKIEKIGEGLNTAQQDGQGALFTTEVALVDYKTGGAKTLGTIKGIDKYGNKKDDMSQGKYYRQLLFYKLLAENDPEFTADYRIAELALDFVEGKDGKYSYMPVDLEEQDFEEFKQLVQDSWEQINSIDFWKEVLGK